MKTIYLFFILIATAESAPRWFPASNGALLDEAQKRAEMDQKLAEFNKNFLHFSTVMEKHRPVLEYMAKQNLEMTESNLQLAYREQDQAKASGDFFGSVIKAVTTGDPMAIFGAVTTGIGLLGLGAGSRNKKKSELMRRKALEYAHMDATASKEKLKHDQDFPDVVA